MARSKSSEFGIITERALSSALVLAAFDVGQGAGLAESHLKVLATFFSPLT